MGMAASQVRLLQLTSRKNTIGRTLENLSLQKTSLSRDMKRVSKNYQDALSTKTLKWSNNSGVTYVDLSYSNLMKPNTYNNNTPYLLTDANGKVVLDSTYEKYAEMLEDNGGKYEGDTRLAILSGLTGISKEQLSNAESTSAAKTNSEDNINKLKEEVSQLESKARNKNTTAEFIQKFGTTSLGRMGNNTGASIYDWYKDTDSNGNTKCCWSLAQDKTNSKAMVKEFLNGIGKTMAQYLGDSDLEKFNKALETVNSNYEKYIDDAEAGNNGSTCKISLDDSGDAKGYYVLNPILIIDEILRTYDNGTSGTTTAGSNTTYYTTYDRESSKYQDYAAKKAELEKAETEHKTIVDTDNQSLTATQESEIKFYDQLFTAMVNNGYEVNSSVEDNDYLNQMLQNNQYYITTMKEGDADKDGNKTYEYDSNIASNFDNIFTVNDTDAQNEAQVEYEYEKSIINEKESRIDQRMQNLETEQSAINEMIKGIESVRDKNIETNFSIFS